MEESELAKESNILISLQAVGVSYMMVLSIGKK